MKHPLLCLAFILCFASSIRAENWAQWRGPALNGSTTESNLPDRLGESTQLWSLDLPGVGASTPIVHGEHVFVSSQEKGTNRLLAHAVDRKTGKLLWTREMGEGYGNPPGRLNNMAAPSAVTDGNTVWFTFGTGDIAAFDFAGTQIWSRNLQKDHGSFNVLYLYGATPLLYKNKLYIQVIHRHRSWVNRSDRGNAPSYLLAIDPASGKDIFKAQRPNQATDESKESYCTPIPYEGKDRTEILVVGADFASGHDPETGKEFWQCGGWNDSHQGNLRIVPSLVVADGLLIVCTPKVRGFTFAIRPGGSGLVTDSHVAWTNKDLRSDVCVPLYYRGNLYHLDGDFNKGLACVEPATGKVKWSTPIQSRSVLRTSPTGADGKIYMMNEQGQTWVMDATDGKILSQSDLNSQGPARASISASQGGLYVRTADRLIAFGKK